MYLIKFTNSFILYYCSIFVLVICGPIGDGIQTQAPVTAPKVLEFMRKYGYLEKNPTGEAESLYSDDAIIEAIKKIQRYGAITESGVLDESTLELIESPRCGVSDIETISETRHRRKRYVIGSKSWKKRKITYFIANWSPKVGEEKVARDMQQAFELWAKYGNIKFIRVYDPSADIIVAFGSQYHGDQYPFDGPGNILAHAFYPYEYQAYGGDIHFDDDENWKENATDLSQGVDFLSVAIHELGHSLGLAHSPIYSAIMFPYYKGPTQSVNLDYDDILAMYQLYIQNTFEEDLIATTNVNEIDDHTDEVITELASEHGTTPRSIHDPVFETPESTDKYTTYVGDYESIEDHKDRFITTQTPPTTIKEKINIPNICTGNFDAVSVLRGEIFIFKGSYVWRLNEKYRVQPGYPVKFRQIFTGLPKTIQRIDAAYERDTDNGIILFTDNLYWIYDGDRFIENSPRNISDFGISTNVRKIDAAMIWDKNKKTYIFTGDQFWRYNETLKKLDDGYPKSMDRWHGIPYDIDASVTMENGKTYFFKGNLYWLYNNRKVQPERGYPRRTSTAWIGCPLLIHSYY